MAVKMVTFMSNAGRGDRLSSNRNCMAYLRARKLADSFPDFDDKDEEKLETSIQLQTLFMTFFEP